MKKKTILLTILTATMVTACSNDEQQAEQATPAQQREIRLSTNMLEANTRSYTATNLQSGDTVYVWTAMVNGSTGEATDYFKAWTLIANGVGGLTPQASGNTKLFPATNALHFFALCGNFGLVTEGPREGEPTVEPEVDGLPTGGILHTVLNDQTTATAYYKSDLLYAVKPSQEPIAEAVQLPFAHVLSRIQVVLIPGNGFNVSDLTAQTTSVSLLTLKNKVMFLPDSTKHAPTNIERGAMLSFPSGTQTGDIAMTVSVSSSEDATPAASTVYADAIVVPQTVAAGTPLIKVTYLGRDTYFKAPAGGMTFESGKQYRIRLTADRIGETYELDGVTVENWSDAEEVDKWFDTLTDKKTTTN
jgi:hypothetical protein